MKRPNFSWKYALIISGIILLVVLVIDFNNRIADLQRLSARKVGVDARVESLEQTKAFIETQIEYATSDAAAIQWAYEEGNMIRSGDNPVVVLPPAESTPVPTPKPVVVRPAISNWEMWYWLFTDEIAGETFRPSP